MSKVWTVLKALVLLLILVAFLFSILVKAVSPNLRYVAISAGSQPHIYYVVIDIAKLNAVFGTNSKYNTPNDVKAGAFSSDSSMFAAAYHYDGPYTWIGVWSTETGQFLYSVERQGYTTDLAGVFK